MKAEIDELNNYWAEVQHTMSEVIPIQDQDKMNVNDFYRQLRIWEKRAKQRIENMKSRHGR